MKSLYLAMALSSLPLAANASPPQAPTPPQAPAISPAAKASAPDKDALARAVCRVTTRWRTADGLAATGEGTGTVIGPRRKGGKWDILTAAHCTLGPGTACEVTLSGGKRVACRVTGFSPLDRADVAWLTTDAADLGDLPHALLGDREPKAGDAVWHRGLSQTNKGALRQGRFTGRRGSHGSACLSIDCWKGDSGCAFFCERTGRVMATLTGGNPTLGEIGPTCVAAAAFRPADGPAKAKAKADACPCGIADCPCGCKDGGACRCAEHKAAGWNWDAERRHWWRPVRAAPQAPPRHAPSAPAACAGGR
jgi:hypothetical protein